MKTKLPKTTLLLILTLAFGFLKTYSQTNIVIDSSTEDKIFLHDGAEGDPFSTNNGMGWSGSWILTNGTSVTGVSTGLNYPSNTGTAVYGGLISSNGTNTIERSFTDTYDLDKTTFYLSFLARRTGSGSLTFFGFAGTNPRYGLQISPVGNIRVRASTQYGPNAEGVFLPNTTYLVVYAKQNSTYKLTVFKEGDNVPTNPDDVNWLSEHTRATGVDLDKFEFRFNGDTFEIDELRLGSTLASVTKSDAKNYQSPLSTNKYDYLDSNLYPNPSNGVANINTSTFISNSLEVSIINSNGKVIYKKNHQNHKGNILLNLKNYAKGLYFVKLKDSDKIYTGKLLIR